MTWGTFRVVTERFCPILDEIFFENGQSLGMKVGKRSLSDVTTRTKISAYIESLSSSTGRWQAA